MRTYQFGERTYTLAEIYETGRDHKRVGLGHYPPRCWGRDRGEYLYSHPADAEYQRGWDSALVYDKYEVYPCQ